MVYKESQLGVEADDDGAVERRLEVIKKRHEARRRLKELKEEINDELDK